jgi:ABC-2 type transport system permease protein
MTINTQSLKNYWQSFKTATWLGWQIESNWTDFFLFAVYSIVKPLAGAAILVVMFAIITKNNFTSPIFPYLYIGNAFYMYVGAILVGISWSIIDDREHYKTLKYIYTSPVHFPMYLLGRCVAKFIIASISVLITILFGMAFLHVRINLTQVNWGLFLISLSVGLVMMTTIGLLLAGVSMLIARHSGMLGEAVAGGLYLFSGAIYPIDVLPVVLRPIGYAMPLTYWLELIRRSLVGSVAQAFPTLAQFSNLQLMGILVGLTIVFGVVGVYVFHWCEQRARERGLIDVVTNY